MAKVSNKVCGIDLGTTNSCVAIMEGGKVKIIQHDGKNTTPSVILFNEKGEKEAVGEIAKVKATLEPGRVVFEVKRLIGRKFDSKDVKEFREIAPFQVVSSKNGDAWVKVEGKEYAPEQVSAFILQTMKKAVEDYLGETVKRAVITVPAYFNNSQREATRNAGIIAGFGEKINESDSEEEKKRKKEMIRIINEPTAAALAYGVDKKKGTQTVAVFDLGGGTFDISIIEISKEGIFEVKATNGDTFLGGANFDQRIIEWLLKEFKDEHQIDLRSRKDEEALRALQKLKEAAEKAKHELSQLTSTDIIQPFIYTDASGPKHINKKLSRQRLKDLITAKPDLLEKLVTPCKKCLEDAKVSKVDEVILVGGMTRMPSIREKVKEIFGKEPNKSVNPDEAVALGAAVQGAVLSGESKEGIVLLDVTPLSLGIETFGGIFTRLIKRNTTIPAGNKQIFSTAVDNQPEVTIRVFQGERELAKDNHFLKQFALSGIRPASKGVPQIEVTFDIDSNGILSITAKDITDPNNVKEVKEIVENIQGGLSEKEVDEMIKKAEASAEKDQELRANIEKLNQARDYLYNFEKQIKEFEKLKDEPQFQEFQKLYENLKEAVDKGDKGDFSQIETALEKIAEMSKVAEELKKKIPKEDEKKDNEDKDKK